MDRYYTRLVFVAVLLVTTHTMVLGTEPSISPEPSVLELNPVQYPNTPGTIELLFRFAPYRQLKGDEQLTVEVVTAYRLAYTGQRKWSFWAAPDEPYATVLQVEIPPNDTSGIELLVRGGDHYNYDACYFVTRQDTVELWKGYPRARGGPRPQPDTTTYLVRIDLRDPVWRKRMERAWLPVHGPLTPAEDPGFFLFRFTKEDIEKLSRKGFKVEYQDSTGWIKLDHPVDSADTTLRPDSTDTQGDTGARRGGPVPLGVSLDSVSGAMDDTTLSIDETVQFFFRYYNGYGRTITGGTNGIRLYSWEGAWWNPPTDDNTTKWLSLFTAWNQKFVNHYGCDGMGADTVGFGGFAMPPAQGMPPGFNERSFVVTTHFDNPYNIGLHLCIDSCFYPPVNEWLWSGPEGGFVPDWAGPYCFVLSRNTIQFKGLLKFRDHRKGVPYYLPMRGIRIEMWEEEYYEDVLLASTEADYAGYFEFEPMLTAVDRPG